MTFDRILLVNNDGKVTVGAPTVASASVAADVVEHIRGEKKLTFKMKRRKGYHKSSLIYVFSKAPRNFFGIESDWGV